jgi:hypothetical protein
MYNSILQGEYTPDAINRQDSDFHRPNKFVTTGMDKHIFRWIIEQSYDEFECFGSTVTGQPYKHDWEGWLKLKLRISLNTSLIDFRRLTSQPHFVSFSPNSKHWGSNVDEISTHAVTDANG